MVEHQDSSEQDNSNRNTPSKKGRSGTKMIALATTGALLLGGVFGVQAFAESKTYAHLKQFASSEDGGWGKHGGKRGGRGHHGDRMRFADMSDAEIDDKITRMVKHVAIEIDADDVQTEKIKNLLTAVAKDLKPVRDQMREAGQEIHQLLLAETIDRQELERIRAERLAEADRISKNLIIAIADVGEVLTAEQRKVLDERIKQFRKKRGGWHRG